MSASKKPGAPGVVLDRSGHRVRLRNIDHALDCAIEGDKGLERVKIQPNVWTTVSDDIYAMLKGKFYQPEQFEVPDWVVGGESESAKRANRMEDYGNEYTIEFPDEAYKEK